MTKLNASSACVVTILMSYALIDFVERIFSDSDYQVYYLATICTCLALVWFCSRFNDIRLLVYAYFQFFGACIYMLVFTDCSYIAAHILYYSTFNFSLILQALELVIIVSGGIDAFARLNTHRNSWLYPAQSDH